MLKINTVTMKDKIKEIIKTYLDGSDDSYDWTTEELLNLFKCDHQFDRIDAKRIQCIKCEQIESRI